MKPGLFQILIIALIVVVLFGRGRIGEILGDFGKGIRSFRKGLGDDEDASVRIESPSHETQPAADKTAG